MIIELTSCPVDEACAQVGDPDYAAQSVIECAAFKAQLLRMYPKPEDAEANINTVTYRHEFGRYRELAIEYVGEAGANWAYLVEAGLPYNWDEVAKAALMANGYRHLDSSLGVSC